jgi:hypothetical protein
MRVAMTNIRVSLIFATVFVLISSLAALGQSRRVQPTPTPTPDDTEKVVTEEIKVNFLAFNQAGDLVSSVSEDDLVVTENDILHQPTSVRRIPAHVLIVMDTGGELRSVKTLDQTKRTARALVAALRPEDSVAVLQYADKAEIIGEWTTDRRLINQSIGRVGFGRRSAFVEALRLGKTFLMQEGIDNRHMVLISDGTDSVATAADKQRAFREILGTDINVHVISYARMEVTDISPRTSILSNQPPPRALPDEVAAQLPPGARDVAQAPRIGPTVILDRKHIETMKARKADLEASEAALVALAEDTNGTIILPDTTDEMEEKAQLVARFIGASHTLTYTPKIALSEGSRDRTIFVTSKREGLVIEARRRLVIDPAR